MLLQTSRDVMMLHSCHSPPLMALFFPDAVSSPVTVFRGFLLSLTALSQISTRHLQLEDYNNDSLAALLRFL